MIAAATLLALGVTAWSAAPDVGVLKCASPMAPSTMTVGYDRPASQIVVRESMVERRQAARFTDDGFQAVFVSPKGSSVGYLFTYHGNTGVLNTISFRPSRAELAEIEQDGGTSEGQARLIEKQGKKSTRAISGAMFLTCTNESH